MKNEGQQTFNHLEYVVDQPSTHMDEEHIGLDPKQVEIAQWHY